MKTEDELLIANWVGWLWLICKSDVWPEAFIKFQQNPLILRLWQHPRNSRADYIWLITDNSKQQNLNLTVIWITWRLWTLGFISRVTCHYIIPLYSPSSVTNVIDWFHTYKRKFVDALLVKKRPNLLRTVGTYHYHHDRKPYSKYCPTWPATPNWLQPSLVLFQFNSCLLCVPSFW